ncbi:hypothetical protein AYI69_g6222 [Smittium culicis]|uniref:Uncharacterized protein n=1 Tax=Smittium culicis TaxID=133412 RepID=A0A1R1Y0S9_9FUNG|nr:hypothetical protein AYI69_g6222 [Smittium culicis]
MEMVERMNRSIRYSLTKSCGGNFKNWCKFLDSSLMGIRVSTNSRTGYSPYFLLFGKHPYFIETQDTTISGLVIRNLEIIEINDIRIGKEREKKSSSSNINFEKGDLVLVLNQKLRKKGLHDKKAPRYEGPMKIVDKIANNIYAVENEK